jgi:hypothetical protein
LKIFFHNDLDGVACASLYLAESIRDMNYVLVPISTHMRGEAFETLTNKEKEPFVIFDFQYAHNAKLWVDHHQNDFMGNEVVKTDDIIYNPRAPSAAGLMNAPDNPGTKTLISAVDMIDSAGYPNPAYIFNDKSPYMILRAFIEFSYPSEMMFARIAEILALCNYDIEKALHIMNIDVSYVDAMRYRAIKIKDRIEIYGNTITIVRQKSSYQFPRFSENFLKPEARYNIRISEHDKLNFNVRISFNKWSNLQNNINIGAYLGGSSLTISGGGHFTVGGAIVGKTKLDEFLNEFSSIVEGEKEWKSTVSISKMTTSRNRLKN